MAYPSGMSALLTVVFPVKTATIKEPFCGEDKATSRMGKVVRLLAPVVVNESYELSEQRQTCCIRSAVYDGTVLTLVL